MDMGPLLELCPKASKVSTNIFFWGQRATLSDNLYTLRTWDHFLNLVQRLLWCQRKIFTRPESHPLLQPQSSRDMRSFLRFKFRPEATVMPKDSFFQGQRVTLSDNLCPLGTWGHFSNLVQRLPKCLRTVFPRPESYPLRQPLSSRDVRPLFELVQRLQFSQRTIFSEARELPFLTTSVPWGHQVIYRI